MKISNIQWWSLNQDAVTMTVTTDEGEVFGYTAIKDDETPLNQQLWNMAMENKSEIQDPEAYRALKGQIPFPIELIQLPCGTVELKSFVTTQALQEIDRQLANLFSPRSQISAARDRDFNQERERVINALFKLEGEFTAQSPETTPVDIIMPEGTPLPRGRSQLQYSVPKALAQFMSTGIQQMIDEEVLSEL